MCYDDLQDDHDHPLQLPLDLIRDDLSSLSRCKKQLNSLRLIIISANLDCSSINNLQTESESEYIFFNFGFCSRERQVVPRLREKEIKQTRDNKPDTETEKQRNRYLRYTDTNSYTPERQTSTHSIWFRFFSGLGKKVSSWSWALFSISNVVLKNSLVLALPQGAFELRKS